MVLQVQLVPVELLVPKVWLEHQVAQVVKVTWEHRALQDLLASVLKDSVVRPDSREQRELRVSREILDPVDRLVLLALLETLAIEEHRDLMVVEAHQDHVAEMVRFTTASIL